MIEWIILGIIALVIVGLVLWVVSIYNRFVSLKNSSEATLGQIRVAMKKRLDMIEQLLGSVKSYAKFEKETLERVTAMRASVATASPGDLNKVEAESRSIFGRLLAVSGELSRPQDLQYRHEHDGLRQDPRGRDRPPALYLQQHLAGIQHHDGHHPLEFRCAD